MNGLGRRLGGFFYQGYSEESLGLFRVYFGCLLLLYHIAQFATLFSVDPGGASFHYTDPIWYFDLLGIDSTLPWLSFLAGLLLVASTLSMTLGKWTRTSIVVVLICIFYLKGVRDSAAGDVHHRYVVLVQILFFLLLSRCGEAAAGRVPKKSAGLLEWEASWPIRAAQVYVAFFYFFALVAKLRVSGWDWFLDGGGRLQEQLIVRSVRWGLSDEGEPLRNALSFHLAGIQLLVLLMCLFVIALELLFPLILLAKRNLVKLCFVACAFLFHVANYVLLDVNFLLYGFVLLVFFDLAQVHRSLAEQRGKALARLHQYATAARRAVKLLARGLLLKRGA